MSERNAQRNKRHEKERYNPSELSMWLATPSKNLDVHITYLSLLCQLLFYVLT